MPERRSTCPISFALDFIGDKWTLVVLRDLILAGKRYYQEFLESPESIATNILAARLKLLEAAGMVTRKADPAHGRRVVYTPTSKALDLLPVMLELVRWGASHDPKSGAPPELVRRMSGDRDAFIAEIRARHERKSGPSRFPGK